MVDILLLQTVSIAIASAGVFAAAIYYILQLRHQTKMRQTDLVIRLYSTYSSEEFREKMIEVMNLPFKDYQDYVNKYGSWFSRGNIQRTMAVVGLFFEGVGVLLYRKAIDVNFAFDLFGSIPIIVWNKIKPVALGVRKELNEPLVFERFEYLSNEMNKRKQTLQQAFKTT